MPGVNDELLAFSFIFKIVGLLIDFLVYGFIGLICVALILYTFEKDKKKLTRIISAIAAAIIITMVFLYGNMKFFIVSLIIFVILDVL